MSGYCLDCGNNPCICKEIEQSKLFYILEQQSCFKEIDIYYVDELQDQIKRLTSQLEKAEEVIEFYADKNNYSNTYKAQGVDNMRVIAISDCDRNVFMDSFGGKRAREYFKDKEK